MILYVETMSAEDVEVSMTEFAEENVEWEVDELEEEIAKDVLEEAAAHMKI